MAVEMFNVADTTNNRIVKVPWNGSSYGPPTTVLGGLNSPLAVKVDGGGSVYIADAGNNRVLKLDIGWNFGSAPVATATPTVQSFIFTFDTAGTLGGIEVLTQGVASLDFVDATTGTCVPGHNYVAGDTCTVEVTFTPTSPGARNGGRDT